MLDSLIVLGVDVWTPRMVLGARENSSNHAWSKRVVKGYVYNSTPNPKIKSIIGKNIPLSK